MTFYTGGIKANTEKKAVPHLSFARYACQTIPKTILALELTVWHNWIIRVWICNLLLAGSIQLCETLHTRAWDSVCQQQHPGKESPTLQWVEPCRLLQELPCRSPHNLPNGRGLMQPLSNIMWNWEQHWAFQLQWAAWHLIFISLSQQKTAEKQHAQHL